MKDIWNLLLAIFLLCAALVCCAVVFLAQQTILAGVLSYVMLFLILGGVGFGVITISDHYRSEKEE